MPLDAFEELEVFLEEKQEKHSYLTLLNTLRKCKSGTKRKDRTQLEFNLSEYEVDELKPTLVGPITVHTWNKKAEFANKDDDYIQIIPYSDFPLTLVRVSKSKLEVIMSFFTPTMTLFNPDVTEEKETIPRYIKVMEVEIPDQHARFQLSRDPVES